MATPKFRRGEQGAPATDTLVAEIALLPEAERLAFSEDLLARLGVGRTKIRTHHREIDMSCPLPFGMHAHGDRSMSAGFNYDKMSFSCFVCGGGGLHWFVGTMLDVGATEARKWLRGEFAITEGVRTTAEMVDFIERAFGEARREQRAPMPRLDTRVLDPWRLIHPYLTEVRGIPEANVVDLSIGYDKRTNRIVIPHFWRGTLVGWQTRRLVADGSPKYKSSPDFPANDTLYALRPGVERVVVVESPMTVAAKAHMFADGPVGLTATFGASVTEPQKRHIAAHERVTLWMDNDPAGWAAVEHIAAGRRWDPQKEQWVDSGAAMIDMTNVWVVDSPWEEDPADLPDGEVRRLLTEHAVPYAVWTKPDPDELREYPT